MISRMKDFFQQKVMSIGRWWKRYWLLAIPGIIAFSLVVCWVLVNTAGTVNDEKQIVEVKPGKPGEQLVVSYPAKVLYNAPPRAVKITYISPMTHSTTLTVTISHAFIVSGTVGVPTGENGDLRFTFPITTATTANNYSLLIANAHTISGTWVLWKPSPTQTIVVQPGSRFTLPVTAVIEVETAKKYVWRKFLTQTVNEKTPLAIAIFALVSWVIYLFRDYREKQVQERDEAEELFEAAKSSLEKAELVKAYAQFNRLKSSGLVTYVAKDDMAYLRSLFKMTEEGISVETVRSTRWIPAVAGLLVALYHNKTIKNTVDYFLAVRFINKQLAFKDININVDIREELNNILQALPTAFEETRAKADKKEELRTEPTVQLPWRPAREKPKDIFTEISDTKIVDSFSRFFQPAAEQDLDVLFGNVSGFWSGHPLYQRLTNNIHLPQVIVGARGSGKTAFAKALLEIGSPEGETLNVFPVYVRLSKSSTSNLRQLVRRKFAQQVWRYFLVIPEALAGITVTGREILAMLICTDNNYGRFAIAEISGRIEKISLNRTTDEKEIFRRSALEALRDSLEQQQKRAQYLTDDEWLNAASFFITQQQFKTGLIALDLDEADEYILHLLYRWLDYNLTGKLFLSQANPMWYARHNILSLIWTPKQLRDMIDWRMTSISQSTGQRSELILSTYFQESIYEAFRRKAEQGTNPRQWAIVWQALVNTHLQYNPNTAIFTQADIDRI